MAKKESMFLKWVAERWEVRVNDTMAVYNSDGSVLVGKVQWNVKQYIFVIL